jgi:hypothetical protein
VPSTVKQLCQLAVQGFYCLMSEAFSYTQRVTLKIDRPAQSGSP